MQEVGFRDVTDPVVPDADATEPHDPLPYELQSKLFDQLATMGVAGAGLVITLRGSILQGASGIIWFGAVEFVLAAVLALTAQMSLIEGLFARRVKRRSLRGMTIIAVVLLGMGIGTLGMSVFLEGDARP